jgi:peptidoglycan/xylan/chitin deacetylase (PgdA/CDA1 family)
MSIVNAMTVDVEDYFHVSAFDTVVSRARWDAFDSRVSHNTDRLLELFDLAHVRSTFFVLGWVAERFPASSERTFARPRRRSRTPRACRSSAFARRVTP